jgi:aminoglycoside phosphotransferase (APT) family kinase protein
MGPDASEVVRSTLAVAGIGPVVGLERAEAGQRNEVWFAELGSGDRVVVRLLADGARQEMETALLERVAAAGVPVAEVLWSSTHPAPVMVQRRLHGRPLAGVAPTDDLLLSLAETLQAIHAVPIAGGFGTLGPDLRGAEPDLGTWFVDPVVTEAAAALPAMASGDTRLVERALAELGAARPLLAAQRTGLAHGDVQPFNVLVVGDRVTGVVDWEAAKAGPPALDFGWWDWFGAGWGTPWPTDRLLAAYDPHGELDREELSELRRLVVLRVWLRELLAGSAPRAEAARRGLASS